MLALNPAPIPLASATVPGAMDIAAQTFAGVKTFQDGIAVPINKEIELNGAGGGVALGYKSGTGFAGIANPAGSIRLGVYPGTGLSECAGAFQSVAGIFMAPNAVGSQLRGQVGGSSGQEATLVGTTIANGSVHAAARLLTVAAGIGGTQVNKAWVNGNGQFVVDMAGLTNTHGIQILNHGGGSGTGIGVGYPAAVSAYMGRADGGIVTFGGNNTSVMLYANGGTAHMVGTLGTGATDVVSKIRTQVADGSVNASAKLLSIGTGMFGTEVEKCFFRANGELENTVAGAGHVMQSPNGTRYRVTVTNAGAIQVAAA